MWIIKELNRHKEQALPHKAPESNPSQKTKKGEKVTQKKQRQSQQQIKDREKHQSAA